MSLIKQLLGEPTTSWRSEGRCLDSKTHIFFPVTDKTDIAATVEARKICAGCPVRQECLDFAISTNQVGIWGGKTTTERAGIRRKMLREARQNRLNKA